MVISLGPVALQQRLGLLLLETGAACKGTHAAFDERSMASALGAPARVRKQDLLTGSPEFTDPAAPQGIAPSRPAPSGQR